LRRPLLILLASLALASCNGRSERAGGALLGSSQQAPALSGSGEWLAVVSDRRGRPTVQLRRLSDRSVVTVPQLSRHQPHSSPSLSWNGRYLALVTQRGRRRLAVVADRLNNRLHPLPLPGGRDPVRVSLSPDARQLALQVADQGRWRVELLDLSDLLEPDRPAGSGLTTPPLEPER
jgi:Tol biopolymer transport system component